MSDMKYDVNGTDVDVGPGTSAAPRPDDYTVTFFMTAEQIGVLDAWALHEGRTRHTQARILVQDLLGLYKPYKPSASASKPPSEPRIRPSRAKK